MATIIQTKRILDLAAAASALGSDMIPFQRGDETLRMTVEQILAGAPTGPGGTVSRAIEQAAFRSAYEDEQMQLGRWSLIYERTGSDNYVLVQELGAGMIGLAYEVEPASPSNPSDRIVALVSYDPIADETAPIGGDGTAEEGIPYFSATDARLLNRPAGQVLRRRISGSTRRLVENLVEFTTLPVPAPTFLETDPNWKEVSPPSPVTYQSLQPLFLMRSWAYSNDFTPGLRYRIFSRGGGAPDVLVTAATTSTLEAGTATLVGGTAAGTFDLTADSFTPSAGGGASTFAALTDAPTANTALAAALAALEPLTGWYSVIRSGTAAIGTGTKSVTIDAGLLLRTGQRVRLATTAGLVEGVATYNATTGALSLVVDFFVGSGTLGAGAHVSPGRLVNATQLVDSTPDGRALLTAADTTAQRAALGLGTAAVLNAPATGNAAAGEVAKGDDTRLTDTRTPTDNTVSTVKLANNAVTNAKLATMATATFKGRTSAGTGAPEDLSVAQAQALLGLTPRQYVLFATAGSTSWVVPTGARYLDVLTVGGGGGGGGGYCANAGTACSGGGGGTGGAVTGRRIDVALELTANGIGTLKVEVGVGGAGGAGRNTVGTSNPGSDGSPSKVSTTNDVTNYVRASGGIKGLGGTTGSVAAATPPLGDKTVGAGGTGPLGAAGGTGGSAYNAPGSGGGGGGISSGNVAFTGGAGGTNVISSTTIAASGGAINTNGAAGPAAPSAQPGHGGAGGGASVTGAAGNGGAPSAGGGGGGGGGASQSGSMSGAGATGATGFVLLIVEY